MQAAPHPPGEEGGTQPPPRVEEGRLALWRNPAMEPSFGAAGPRRQGNNRPPPPRFPGLSGTAPPIPLPALVLVAGSVACSIPGVAG